MLRQHNRQRRSGEDALRAFIDALAADAQHNSRTFSAADLCEFAAQSAWTAIKGDLKSCIDHPVAPRLRSALQEELQRALQYLVGPCTTLVKRSAALASDALSSGLSHREQPPLVAVEGAIRLFTTFPVLARLWSDSVRAWSERSVQLLHRVAADRGIVSATIFNGRELGKLSGLKVGLSDPHHGGRTAAAVRFDAGIVIYKPRSGSGEAEWQNVLSLMNRTFRPKLRELSVVQQEDYCWMEYVQRAACRDVAGVRRFYRRAGALAAAAELLHAVDCHKGNVIAAGEHPVLVDADALLHPPATAEDGSEGRDSSRTQFFAVGERRAKSTATAALSAVDKGAHVPRLNGRYAYARDFEREILSGFADGWRALAGTAPRRAAFARLIERLNSLPRRRIYRATRRYESIRRASLQPHLMRDSALRRAFLQRSCDSKHLPPDVVDREIEQLTRLDIPYFTHRMRVASKPHATAPSRELLAWIRGSLQA